MNPSTRSFQEHDKLNLEPFAKQFEKFLIVEHHFADDALVVSLNAPFGSGKSTFLEMWRHDLEQRREKDPKLPLWVELTMTGATTSKDSFLHLAQEMYPFYQKYNVRNEFANPAQLKEQLVEHLRGWGGAFGLPKNQTWRNCAKRLKQPKGF